MPESQQLIIGSIVRAHGVRGELVVYVTTDEPEDRYVAGSVLHTDPATAGPLTIEAVRVYTAGGRPQMLITFDGVYDRDTAERLRGVKLLVDASDVKPSDDPDEFHDFELVGLSVTLENGENVGEIIRINHGPGADLLIVKRPDGRQTLIPFVKAIVPSVDVAGGRVVITPPEGLLEL
ncbi:MAG TPA: ribosome maturation factor RimM [Micromonosporaceae bacterium]